MKLFENIKFYAKRLGLNKYFAIAALGLLLAVPAATLVAEYYPDRTPFDYNKPCDPTDDDIYDRCGSLTGPVFNSFINTPSYGDERAFVDARRSDQTAAGSYENVLQDVTDGSKEVVIRMYVHNNANQDTNESGLGIAKNTRVRVLLPTGQDDALRARGYITADNAGTVEDTVDFVGNNEFTVEYVPGSATLYDNNNFSDGVQLSDNIVTENGALIGSDSLNGDMKGCFEDEAVVQLRVRIVPVEVPEVDIQKQVATATSGGWAESSTVAPGDRVAWLINFDNVGLTDLTNVNINDKLPPHLSVDPGTVQWTYRAENGNDQTVTLDDGQLFTTGGYNFGNWSPDGGFYVRFDTTALDNFDGCEISIRNVARVNTDQTNQAEDVADVTIRKNNCEEEVSFACESFTITSEISRTTREVALRGSVNNTVTTAFVFNESGPEGDHTHTFNSFGQTEVSYLVFSMTPGDYTISAQIVTPEGTTPVSNACTINFTVDDEPELPAYTCDLLDLRKLGDTRQYEFTAAATADGGAEIKQYRFDFGDGTEELLTTEKRVQHTYKKDGTFVATVEVDFTVDGETVTAGGDGDCKVIVRVNTDKPTELPDTGPAETAGMFSLITVGGAMAHRFFNRKRA